MDMQRRAFLKNSLLLASSTIIPSSVFGLNLSEQKILKLYNIHTGEKIKATFFEKNQFIESEIKRLNYFFRDYRLNKVADMDVNLYLLLHAIQLNCGSNATIDIISGYRSKKTNEYLRRHHHKVAKKSFHTKAMAIDFKIKDRYLKDVLKIARVLEYGGVGYYPKNSFIHIDTGPVRFWHG